MKKIGLYCGSFNPFHIGHLNILEQAETFFGKENVIIALGVNPMKQGALEDLERRKFAVQNQLRDKKVAVFTSFLTDYINELLLENPDTEYWLIRGLRNGEDLNLESTQIQFMKQMKHDLNVVFFICDKKYEHISSSACRALEAVKKGASYAYLGGTIPTFYVIENEKIILELKYKELNLTAKILFQGAYEECIEFMLKKK